MPLYLQIVHGLIQEIERGRLQPGTYLPSSRAMATSLGVNRKTVVLAYEDLVAQGWLVAAGTRGTVVADSLARNSKQAGQAARDRRTQGGGAGIRIQPAARPSARLADR